MSTLDTVRTSVTDAATEAPAAADGPGEPGRTADVVEDHDVGPAAGPDATVTAAPGVPAGSLRVGRAAASAFVLGLVALLLVVRAELALVSLLGGAVAVVLGIAALRCVVPGGAGQGFAMTAVLLGAVAVVSAPPPTPAHEDLGSLDCAALAEEAMRLYGEPVPGREDDALLAAVEATDLVEDHRTDYVLPVGDDVSLVLACTAVLEWSDGATSSGDLELTVDTSGEMYVDVY